jgi:methanogen homoaconitase small subunit
VEADVCCTQGDTVLVDLGNGTVCVGGKVVQGTKLPDFLLLILQDGGLVAHRRKKKQEGVP